MSLKGPSVNGAWWRNGVVYQIYPWSFADANGDGIGDLRGIVARLDHLNGATGSLGVDAIWLSPFYPSPMTDFGYDVADHCDVDPRFGTLEDFDALVAECHRRSIKVVVDLVPNHTSERHRWFVESRSNRDSPKREWYVWRDPAPDGSPPTNWLSVFQTGREPVPAWTFDPGTGQYYLHSFLPTQPDLNWFNPQVRDAMKDVVRFWLDRGVDGFRTDAVHRLGHDPTFADDPLTSPERYPEDLPIAHDVVRMLRSVLDEYDDRMMVGEAYLLDLDRMIRYYGNGGDEFDLVFNFSFLRQRWSAAGFRRSVERFEAALPTGGWPDYTLSNHDHARTVTRYGRDGCGRMRARLAAMMLLTLRGTPFLYYGEEIGMADVQMPRWQWRDPMGRDGCRTPMRWEPGGRAGFSNGEPWLPIGIDIDEVNVASQRDDPTSMLALYRDLLSLRRRSPALTEGSYSAVPSARGVFVYERRAEDEAFIVALNFATSGGAEVELPAGATVILSTEPSRPPAEERGDVSLRPLEGVVARLESTTAGSRPVGRVRSKRPLRRGLA